MNYRGVIRNFRNLNTEQIVNLKEALGISMPNELLSHCVLHYRKSEMRDPYIDELHMLDRLSALLEQDVNSLTPTELFTNNDFIAQTYADMLEKRKSVNPNATYPCTITEAARLASLYLFRIGKANSLRAASLIPEHWSDHPVYPNHSCISSPDSSYRLRVLPFVSSVPQKGDLLLLLSPKVHEAALSFQKKSEMLLESEELIPYLKGVYTVRNGGLLREILEITNSAWIDLSAFSPMQIPLPMTVLVEQFHGSRILRINEKALADVMKMMKNQELNASVFAQITNDARITFSRGKEEPFSIHPQFLRLLFRYKSICVKLPDEAMDSIFSIHHRVVTEATSRYLSTADFINQNDSVTINGMACAAASSAPRQTFFKSAIYTVLSPILTLAACGIDYSKQQLSIGLEVPKSCTDPSTVGECMAQILGLYRVQTELAVPAQAVALHTTDERSHPSITAFSVFEGNSLPGTFTNSESFVYCVSPQIDKNGIPNFASVRQLMARLTDLGQRKEIYSIKILCNECITQALQEMRHEYSYHLTDSKIASEGPLPFAIILESAVKLEFRLIARTVPFKKALESHAPSLPDLTMALNRLEKTEITLFSDRTDSDALALASLLSARGACVRSFEESSDVSEIVRSLLSSQVLILCKGPSLPEDERIAFALDTLKRAGGCIISLNSVADPSYITLSEGICEEILMKICSK